MMFGKGPVTGHPEKVLPLSIQDLIYEQETQLDRMADDFTDRAFWQMAEFLGEVPKSYQKWTPEEI